MVRIKNPYPRREENLVRIHGYNLAHEAIRVANDRTKPLQGPLACGLRHIKLPFDKLPSEAELKEKAAKGKSLHEKYHANFYLGDASKAGGDSH